MQKLLVSSLALAICAPALAQNTTSPTGHMTKEGDGFAYYVGGYPNMRTQILDLLLVGKKRTLAQLKFRLDDRNHTTTTAPGRTFTNVTLMMGEGPNDLTKFTNTFTANYVTTGTTVFSGPVTWPSVVGKPTTKVWGGPKGEYTFPFKSNVMYSGVNGLLQSWAFHGGTLANKVTWSSTSLRTYYLDSVLAGSAMCSQFQSYVPDLSANTCRDSAHTSGSTYTFFGWCNFDSTYSVSSYRDKMYIYSGTYRVAAGKPLISVWGSPVASANGINVGDACGNNLRVDLTKPAAYWFTKANATGTFAGYAPGPSFNSILIKAIHHLAGTPIAAQAAWNDSKTGQFKLTKAGHYKAPGAPRRYKKASTFQRNHTSATGLGPYRETYYYMWPMPYYHTK